MQFEIPSKLEVKSFIQNLIEFDGNFEGCLLQINDWAYDSEYEAEPTADIRLRYGETRLLIEAPGHLFSAIELSDVIELCALIIERGWSAYLYLTSKMATFLLWEGELIDFWSIFKKLEEQVHAELCYWNIRIIHRSYG